jgi:tRNA(fMet)-specific endonuclease VapC
LSGIASTPAPADLEHFDRRSLPLLAVNLDAASDAFGHGDWSRGPAVHAHLAVEATSKGRPRSAHDMMIAATASATNRILLTTDAKAGFDQLTGVRYEVLTTS